MSSFCWFATPVIGARTAHEIAHTIMFLDKDTNPSREDDASLEKGATAKSPFPFRREKRTGVFPWQQKPWLYTAHALGYLAPISHQVRVGVPIKPLSTIRADPRLKRSAVTMTLDRLRVHDYPGSGTHRVLTHVAVQHQTRDTVEDLHYNMVYRVREGEEAALRGYPIFVGLGVGAMGLRIRCRTINVCNDQDEAFLSFLESDVMRSGLQLVATAQPALAPFSQVAFGLAKALGERSRNIAVQDIDLGLDFGTLATGARLAIGSYVAVQMPLEHLVQWDWNQWVYDPSRGLILQREDRCLLPYNYLIFGITPYEEA